MREGRPVTLRPVRNTRMSRGFSDSSFILSTAEDIPYWRFPMLSSRRSRVATIKVKAADLPLLVLMLEDLHSILIDDDAQRICSSIERQLRIG